MEYIGRHRKPETDWAKLRDVLAAGTWTDEHGDRVPAPAITKDNFAVVNTEDLDPEAWIWE